MIAVRLLLWLTVLVVFGSPVVAWYAIEDKPLVTKSPKIGVADIKAAKEFLAQYDPRNIPDGKITTITASQSQINLALATALAAAPMLKARVVPSPYGLLAAITGELPVPQNPVGRYVNIRILLKPSTKGLQIGRLVVGEIEVPTIFVRPVFMLVMDQLAGPGRGRAFLDTIQSVQIAGDRISIVYNPKDGLMEEIKGAAKTAVAAADPEITKVYWARVNELQKTLPKGEQVSLTRYLRPIFALAGERSKTGNPIAENKGAIFALAMFFADIRVERFIGNVRVPPYDALPSKTGNVVLQDRHDWIQHYLLSAALHLTGGRGVTDFIGEIKELSDTGKESGFSFTDIAADRTGVRLAEIAAGSVEGARLVQKVLSGPITEKDMFPLVKDFPEGLTEQQFRATYGDRGTPEFNKQIAEMDRRIAAIPLYR